MRKFVEKIVIGVLSVALVLAVLGLVLSLRVLANAALVTVSYTHLTLPTKLEV